MTEIKSISPLSSQLILRELGLFCSSYMSNDIYFLFNAVNLLISDLGDEYISQKYMENGKDWNEIKEKLARINKLVIKTKTFYDPILDKKFEKKKADDEFNKTQIFFKRYFNKNAGKIALIQRDLYDIFIFLVKNSSIQRQTIPNEAFKILEHQNFRKITLDKRPGAINQSQTTEGADRIVRE